MKYGVESQFKDLIKSLDAKSRLDIAYDNGYEAAMKVFDEKMAQIKRGITMIEECSDETQFAGLESRMKEVVPELSPILSHLFETWLKTIYLLSKDDIHQVDEHPRTAVQEQPAPITQSPEPQIQEPESY